MTARPGVDVVIATHDRPMLVRQAIDAVLDQTYAGEVRVVVVHDRTVLDLGLRRSMPGRSVDVIANHRRPGLAGARNSGIDHGELELVAFCDDDDVWLPGKLEQQVERLEASGAATCVSGILVEYADRTVPRVPGTEELSLTQLVRHRTMAAHPSTVLVRRDALLERIGLVDESIPGGYGEDFDWILRAAQSGPVTVVDQPLVRVRWGQSQFSQGWETIVAAIDHGIARNPVFRTDRRALGRLYGRRSFALAAMGSREVWPTLVRTLRLAPLEPRVWLATAVAMRLVSAERLMDLAHRRGHGI